jgi:hypothetical protein
MNRIFRAVLILALGAAIAMLGFHRLALTDLIFGKGDAYHYFTPLWAARDAALRAGQLPLWTNDLFMGAPLLADSQLGTFYPPNWLTVWLPAWEALKVSVLLHVAWAAAGAFVLARRALGVGIVPSIIGAGVFALGGYVGAHAEQINQLQGIAWLPWAVAAISFQWPAASEKQKRFNTEHTENTERTEQKANSGLWAMLSLRRVFPLALVLAMIALSGHTQTLFITGVGLGIYALVPRPQSEANPADDRRTRVQRLTSSLSTFHFPLLLLLAFASLLALVLAAVQILPTLELTGLSNRQGGFSAQAALAFSWSPNLAARGLLPSLDGQVFGEYVAFLGVFGLGLALWGAFYGGARRWPWVVLCAAGMFLAFGLYNPLNWLIAELPGFDLFRVPARWLALFALGGAMLSAFGAQTMIERAVHRPQRGLLAIALIVGALAVLAVWRSPAAALEVDGSAAPTLPTLILWAAAALLFANAVLLRGQISSRTLGTLLLAVTLGELAIAATNMPHRDLVDPMAATDPRMTAYQVKAASGEPSSPRILSISLGYFDTYDHAGLVDRYGRLGMTERASKAGLTAAKLKELLAPNFPLLYGVPSVDGFGGGLLPTVYYSAFTSRLLPEGAPRTLDGRLRELLARPECFGACVPEPRWMKLMGAGYLILDKTYDRFYDDVQFDLGLSLELAAGEAAPVRVMDGLVADQVHVLATADTVTLTVNGDDTGLIEAREVDDGLTLLRFDLGEAAEIEAVELAAESDVTVRAVTLVDSRVGIFTMLPLGAWEKLLSSDIKLYRTTEAFPPAFSVREVQITSDDWNGSEAALNIMRDPAFDPARQAVLHGAPETVTASAGSDAMVIVVSRTDTRTEYAVEVTGEADAVIVMNDAYFPGWTAEIDGEAAPLYRADVMFRAVVVPPGRHTVIVEYRPPWLQPLLAFGAAAWLVFALAWLSSARLRSRQYL